MADNMKTDKDGVELHPGDTVSVEGSTDLYSWEGYHVDDHDQYCVRNTSTGKCSWARRSIVKGDL